MDGKHRGSRRAARTEGRTTAPRPTVHALLNEAVRHHQAGLLAEAEQRYRQVLAAEPQHVDCLHLLGVVAYQTGDHATAAELIRQAIALRDDVPYFHANLGNALKRQGRVAEAVTHYRRAVTLKPDYAEVHNNLGNAAKAGNDIADAIGHYQRALAARPDFAEAHYNLGTALLDLGRFAEAVVHFGRALALKLDVAELHNNLGNALKGQDQPVEAVAHYRRALALNPDFAEAHNNLGNALKMQRRTVEAMTHYRRALELRPDYAEAHNNLGSALVDQGAPDDAVAHFERALVLKPGTAEVHNNLGNAFIEQGRYAEAVAQFERALALKPGVAAVHGNLGNALKAQNRFAEAVEQYQRALALKPDFAEVLGNLGNIYKEHGALAAAEQAYEKAVDLAPRTGLHYRHLFAMRKAVAGDRSLAAMEQLARDMPALPTADQKELHFALGKACADQEQYEASFRHLLQGNALRRREVAYDEPATLAVFERVRAVFTRDLMHSRRNAGDPSEVPIFILGMPRSGTTLIEQILASHPGVFGAGELKVCAELAAAFSARVGAAPYFPEAIPALADDQLGELGARYLDIVGAMAPAAVRVIDKMPQNFFFLGLIHLALPNARIIHLRRDPIDTCLSCFALLFESGQPYSYDLGELGRYYRAYAGLMEHWRQVLPEGVMLDVQYEDVVTDLEHQARRIVAHCDLHWDDACLEFHRTRRPVRTASAVQVQQPIYRTSIGRWRPYRALLQPLVEALGLPGDALAGAAPR